MPYSSFSALTLFFSLSFAVSTDGSTDLLNLQAIIAAASNTIWTPLNATGGSNVTYLGGLLPTIQGTIGTADLIANLTGTILGSKYGLDVNKAAFVNNTPVPMDEIYVNYLDAIPTLSSALIALGKSWHQELNVPIYLAIEALTQSIHGFGSSLLQADLITSNTTIRTIHVPSTLSNAQAGWSKILNYPGQRRRSVPIAPREAHEPSIAQYDAPKICLRDILNYHATHNVRRVYRAQSALDRRVGTVVGRSIGPWA